MAVENCSGCIGQRCHQSGGLTITMLASGSARTAREDASDGRDIHWQQWQGDRHIAAAVALGSGGGANRLIASTRQGQGGNGAGPAQARQGQCNNGVMTEVTRERENG